MADKKTPVIKGWIPPPPDVVPPGTGFDISPEALGLDWIQAEIDWYTGGWLRGPESPDDFTPPPTYTDDGGGSYGDGGDFGGDYYPAPAPIPDAATPYLPPPTNYGTTSPVALEFQNQQKYRRNYSIELTSGRVARRRRRSQTHRKWRLRKPKWVDPMPWIPGTEPEKRVMEALLQRHIFFIFQGQIPEFEAGDYVTLSVPGYEPDFVLPQYRLIIDPWSPYFHSLASHVGVDEQKIALYESMGYRYYHPWALNGGIWSFDQIGVGHMKGTTFEMLSQMSEFSHVPLPLTDPRDIAALPQGFRIGQNLGAGATSVAAANKARARPKMRGLKR